MMYTLTEMEACQRTQIYLKKSQLRRLKTYATRQKKTVSHLIRAAIDRVLEPAKGISVKWKKDPFLSVIGKGKSSDTHLSQHVDFHLYGISGKE